MSDQPNIDWQRDEDGNPKALHAAAQPGERYLLPGTGQVAEVLAVCPVLWKSWEGDDVAYVVRFQDGSRRLISGLDEEGLRAKMKEYREAIALTEQLLAQL